MKKVLSLLLAVVMILSVFFIVPFEVGAVEVDKAETSAYTSGDYEYTVLSDGTAKITDYAGYASVLNIPSSLDGYKVTSIGDNAFYGCESLTSITIPDSVTSIGANAFQGCLSLTSITIPDGVTSIGYYAFFWCKSLISITIPDSVTSIGDGAFLDTGLTSITIPEGVSSIGEGVFFVCSSLTTIKVDSNNKYYDSRDNCNAIIETSTNTLIYGCQNTVIPDSVTSIGNNAFYYCSSLKSVSIPDGVTSIGDEAFTGCKNLNSITIPDGVTSIGDYAFYDCKSLTSIAIPDSVTNIGDSAFSSCESLTSITIPDSVTSIGDKAFYHCYSLTSIAIYSKDCTVVERSIPDYTKIYCYEGSTAHEYALSNGNEYEFITDILIMLGDVNGDGDINILDVTEIQRHIAQLTTIADDRLSCADANKDGQVNILDATHIQRFIAQLIPEL